MKLKKYQKNICLINLLTFNKMLPVIRVLKVRLSKVLWTMTTRDTGVSNSVLLIQELWQLNCGRGIRIQHRVPLRTHFKSILITPVPNTWFTVSILDLNF